MKNFFSTYVPVINKCCLPKIPSNYSQISFFNLSMSCYCIIGYNKNNMLKLSYYSIMSVLSPSAVTLLVPIIFIAKNARNVCILLQYHQDIINSLSPDHCLYLGRELMKAEIALIMQQQYIQS